MKHLYMMRHGQTLFNVRRRIQGSCDSPLTELGIKQAEAAKELIMETEVPYIVNRGRKGGSNVAAAICNALLYELTR